MEFSEDSGSDYIPPNIANRSYASDSSLDDILPPNSPNRSHVSDSNSDNNNISTHSSEDHQGVPKKRSRNVQLWKKNVRKAKKIREEAHIGATGKVNNAKTFEPIICNCSKKCHNFISDTKQKEIHKTFMI